jgi:predicted branched-subunit amino acid permease
VGTYGTAFGASGIANGFTVLQTCLLSLLLFSGASQFAFVGVMGAGGSALSGIATGGLLGFRNGLYALRMSQLLQVRGIKKFIAAQLTIDESTGVALAQEGRQVLVSISRGMSSHYLEPTARKPLEILLHGVSMQQSPLPFLDWCGHD